MDMFSTLLVSLRFDNRSLGGNKRSNCQLTNLQVFQLIVLMPFFAIKGFSHYKNSILNRMFGGRKDVFYSFMAQDHINWRRLIYRMSVTLVSSITCRKDFKKSHLPAVLIYFMCYNYDHLLDYRKILINTKTPDFTFLDVKSGVCFVKY